MDCFRTQSSVPEAYLHDCSLSSDPDIAYLHDMRMKIKKVILGNEKVGYSLHKQLGSIERILDLLLDLVKSVDVKNRASKIYCRSLKQHFADAIFMCLEVERLFRIRGEAGDWTKETEGLIKASLDGHIEILHKFLSTPGELVVGLEEDVQVLSRNLVFEEEKKVIWIVGRKGIGKSTLAKEVYKQLMVLHNFHLRVWVTIEDDQGLSYRDVLVKVLRSIPEDYFAGKKLQYSTSSKQLELEKELFHIFNSFTCLLVLDGLKTNVLLLEELGEFMKFSTYGSKIMITTRICNLKDSRNHKIHELRTLGDEDAWELFNARVRVPRQMKNLGLHILRKCMGLPLNIVTVGDLLSKRPLTEDQWLMVVNQESVFLELEAAVNSLPRHLKDCLSSFEIFNDDFDIPVRRLIVYWVAEGHIQQQESGSNREPPEILAEKQLMEFIKLNMIQVVKWKLNGRVKSCRMNHSLRDTWLPIANKEKSSHDKKNAAFSSKLSYFLNFNHKESASNLSTDDTGTIIRLADHLDIKEKCFSHIHGNQKISYSSFKQNYGHLCSLVSFDQREGPIPGEDIGSFLHRGIIWGYFRMLRILDLEGVFRPNLPVIIGKLHQLRYLGLRRTYLEELPSTLGKLHNLQTLDLKDTCIRSLPCSVWEMQQLRHLYLCQIYRSRIVAPPRTSSLLDIQTLWGAFVDNDTLVANGLDGLINLRKLGLVCRLTTSQEKELAEWISQQKHLESLRLRSIDDMVRPSNLYLKSLSGLFKLSSIYLLGRLENPIVVHDFPKGISEITLSASELVKDPMQKLEKLQNLRILNLYAGSYIGKTMSCSSGGFPLLRILNLWKLEQLEEWKLEEGALKILRDLEIRSCNKLKKIPDGVEHLKRCRELKLTNMPDEFKARVTASEGQDWHKVAHVPSVIIKN